MRFKFLAIPLLIILADQLTKYYFKAASYDLGFLKLHFVKNFGAGFGILQGERMLLIIVPIIVIGLIIYYLKDANEKSILLYGLLFLLGGVIGNLIDRIFSGYVVDFIDLGFWPVFNIADSMNCVAGLLIVVSMMKEKA